MRNVSNVKLLPLAGGLIRLYSSDRPIWKKKFAAPPRHWIENTAAATAPVYHIKNGQNGFVAPKASAPSFKSVNEAVAGGFTLVSRVSGR